MPSSRYGLELAIMEAMHWTYDEYLDQPADLVAELAIRMEKRALAERKAAKRAEMTRGK